MERISPPLDYSFMLKKGDLEEGHTSAEFSIMSGMLWDRTKNELLENSILGNLVRVKG